MGQILTSCSNRLPLVPHFTETQEMNYVSFVVFTVRTPRTEGI